MICCVALARVDRPGIGVRTAFDGRHLRKAYRWDGVGRLIWDLVSVAELAARRTPGVGLGGLSAHRGDGWTRACSAGALLR